MLVPADTGRDAMQPTATHGGAPVDDAEHTVLAVHTFHEFSHGAHDRRTFIAVQHTRAGSGRASVDRSMCRPSSYRRGQQSALSAA
jgi:hypothetical protein